VPSGTQYAVTVQTQPTNPTQVCSVANGTGTVAAAPVTNIAVTCATSTFSVGGTITNLDGSGLVLASGATTLQVAPGSTTFAFTGVPSGTPYAVTIQSQPSNPTQVCTVANGTGTVGGADVSSVSVTCVTTPFNVFAQVSGLAGSGLQLQLNGVTTVPITMNGVINIGPLESGSTYTLTVLTQPTAPAQTCTVTNGSGTIGASDVTVAVSCATNAFTVGGTVVGLLGNRVVLQLSILGGGGTSSATVSGPPASPDFTFDTPVPSGRSYQVEVTAQPQAPAQTCLVTANAAGTMGSAPVTNVVVTCTTNA
jgi:hypothetical protein